MICRIADFNVEFKNISKGMENFLKKYSCDQEPQLTLQVSQTELDQLRLSLNEPINDFQLEIAAFYDKLLEWAILQDAIFLHSSLIEYNGSGIAFTALSGTGKSTHTLLWQNLLGDKMQIINGDKPIIRFFGQDNTPYGYGTPWCGKEGFSKNAKTPIKHICFIERSTQNSCIKISAKDALNRIFNQIFIPKDQILATKSFELLNRLLQSCDIWVIKCNTDISAAQVAFNAIFKENKNET